MPPRIPDEGQGLVEYALILVLVAVVVIVILALLGPAIGDLFADLVDGLQGAQGS
ncbi:MAG: pilus assembly protein [Anaerolineaceae bacterium]|nr:pilus assembly protein [Anaerolineaceae bacterium]MCY4024257.1 pilus assembly protein [Anaerolineaceae bacterium]